MNTIVILKALLLFICVLTTLETITKLPTTEKSPYMFGCGLFWVLFYIILVLN